MKLNSKHTKETKQKMRLAALKRPKKYPITKQYLIKEYIENRKSSMKIAKIFNCSDVTIRQYLKKYSIKIRTKSEALKGHIISKNIKDRISKSLEGYKHSLETKRKFKRNMLKRWQNKEYKNRVIKKWMKSLRIKPNKPEKLLDKFLQKILPNEYKYVGNGKVILGGLNPDFINYNGQKKIIELYGDYWHNRKDTKKRDKRRSIVYGAYGYQTLIFWEHELKDLHKAKQKILKFNRGE